MSNKTTQDKKDSRGGDVGWPLPSRWNGWTVSQLEAEWRGRGTRIIEMREEMDELQDENIKLQQTIVALQLRWDRLKEAML